MSTALSTAHADADGAAAAFPADDHRIALLTARTALEPELAKRYSEDPCSLLAEFGLPAAEPVYATWPTAGRLVIEDLDRASMVASTWCVSTNDMLAAVEAARR
ncbi:hypothetical protein [Streptomyces sp. NPDC018610]|jgi:hypothetical protein|uniref:hypothetical protein n=1 Tax=Streptomyces sp. NPDC018610 TaxID=3365049 RepID=UPI0037A63114